jgi:peptidylprolyl isomerase
MQEKLMSQAKPGDTVKIHYTGTLDDGTQFDSSSGRDPLQFEVGSGQVIPGFDKAVEGMAVGDSKSVNIPPEDAYGPRHDQMIQDVPKTALPDDLEPVEGMALQAQGQDGQVINLTVTAVSDDSITVDGNHPLAGQALNFDIELVDIARTA